MRDTDTEAGADSRINNEEGVRYWETIAPDVNGMLGGFPHVSRADLQSSRNFLAKLGIGTKEKQHIVQSALEGGAGIGRITKGLLLEVAELVDVVEPVAKFTDELKGTKGIRHILNVGLQDWIPPQDTRYDLIWNQWCLGHLTDKQLVQYLQRCRASLQPSDGWIVIKENLSSGNADLFDEVDSSVTRTNETLLRIFQEAGLQVIRTELQRGFPKQLYPVRMYALKPV